jgi:hypothetical protein
MFSTLIPICIFAFWLGRTLGVNLDKPVNGQPNGDIWLVAFLASMVCGLIIGYIASFVVMAAVLRWRYNWSSARIKELMFESNIPNHWFKIGCND